MNSVATVRHQSWPDLAVQTYGNVDALLELLDNSVTDDTETDLAQPVALSVVQVDETSTLVNKTALKVLNGAIIATMSAMGDYDGADYDEEDYEV